MNETIKKNDFVFKEKLVLYSIAEQKRTISYPDCFTNLFSSFSLCSFLFWSITVVVGNIPSSDPSGRLILLPKASVQYSALSDSKRAKKKSDYKIGSLVEAEVQLFSIMILKLVTVFIFNVSKLCLKKSSLDIRLLISSHLNLYWNLVPIFMEESILLRWSDRDTSLM